ncbi:ferritin-like domain-containing protein [Rhodocytophaga aerolata]|uniref:Ferritin-like domain-containing protein n=1 Tax=Rhodocytophaga aerolata TaxID=455078 RepID=A0ABT8RHB9_9BACT|nr:ferritin-like domain-containing protein [Rhodocytophaga aerolata]MDO1451106.1 ferritin-like domain-containing protein [Rhodocytophaga aerolata]
MNLFHLISQVEKLDPQAMDQLVSRRNIFTQLAGMSKKAALVAAPLLIGSAFNQVLAGNKDVPAVFNYALLLEYLEEDFYLQALAKPGLIPTGAPMNAIMQIKKHESAHVALLKGALGGAANPRPSSFNFGAAFDNYPTFLAFAQALEDTGVRAYKGKAGEIKEAGNPNDYLTVALQIHSVEARHAAHIRMMRRGAAGGGIMQAGWISNAEANGAPQVVYGPGNPATTFPSEGNTTQAGLNLVTALGTTYTAAEVSEAFDEALDEATVRSIAGPFIVA